jgi:hypothetical protein
MILTMMCWTSIEGKAERLGRSAKSNDTGSGAKRTDVYDEAEEALALCRKRHCTFLSFAYCFFSCSSTQISVHCQFPCLSPQTVFSHRVLASRQV